MNKKVVPLKEKEKKEEKESPVRRVLRIVLGLVIAGLIVAFFTFLTLCVIKDNAQPVHVTVIVDNEVVLDYEGTRGSYREIPKPFSFSGTGRYCFTVGNKEYYYDNPQLIVEALEE